MSQMWMLLESPEAPARASLEPDTEKAWMIRVLTSPLPSVLWFTAIAPVGSVGKMSPASVPSTAARISRPSSGGWSSSGMAACGEVLMLSCRPGAAARACVPCRPFFQATGDVPPRFFLTPRACAGILRRAGNRGRRCRQLAGGARPVAGIATTTSPSPRLRSAPGRGTARAGESRGQDNLILAFGGNNTAGPIDLATACNAHPGGGRYDFESETFVVEQPLPPIARRAPTPGSPSANSPARCAARGTAAGTRRSPRARR